MFTKSDVVASLLILSLIFPFLTQSAYIGSETNQDKSVSIEAGGVGPYDDEFNSSTLNPNWNWINPDTTKWSLTSSPGNLRIIGTNNDMWESCNNPKNLLLQQLPAQNFEIQTKLTISPTVDYQQGGLLIFGDVDNYIKLDVVWNKIRMV
jgi:beta-xylosidase